MTAKSIISVLTEDQCKSYKRFIEGVADRGLMEASIDQDGLQQLIQNEGEFQTAFTTLITKYTASNQYAGEEVASGRVYGSGYVGFKPIAKQARILRRFFPKLGSYDEVLATAKPTSSLMEGAVALPHWSSISSTYEGALKEVMAAIGSKRSFLNTREHQIGSRSLKEGERKVSAFLKLREEQKGHSILIVAAQFGLRHAGRSAQRAREMFVGKEFGFGAYEVGILLLTHPKRLKAEGDLWIGCPGDEYVPVDEFAPGNHHLSAVRNMYPAWCLDSIRLRFGCDRVDHASGQYGSVSGLLLESET